MATYFSDRSLKFMRSLARNNSREWFLAHKADYETHVRAPFLALLGDLQPVLREVSVHFRAEPKTVGGSLYRIHRDTRFSNDKTPYKTWQGARLFHERGRELEAPLFYVQLQPGGCMVAAGLWHPQPDTLRRVRQFIVDNPESWARAVHSPAFHKRFALDDSDMLTRPPRGFPADFAHVDDLRHKNFAGWRGIDDAVMTGPRLLSTLQKDLQGLAPLMDYLCAALDLEF